MDLSAPARCGSSSAPPYIHAPASAYAPPAQEASGWPRDPLQNSPTAQRCSSSRNQSSTSRVDRCALCFQGSACASRGTMPAPPRDRGAGQQSTDAGGNTRRVVAGLLAAWRCHVRRQRRAQGSNQLIAICEAARSSESRFYQHPFQSQQRRLGHPSYPPHPPPTKRNER